MKLLKITERPHERFKDYFEEVQTAKIEEAAPEVISGKPGLRIQGEKTEADAAYIEIPQKNAVFGRPLLETFEESRTRINAPSTAFYVTSKKNYLHYTLNSRDLPAPKTTVAASEKACRNIEKHLKGPLLAKKFEGLQETERKKLETVEDIQGFAEGLEHPENMAIFHHLEEKEAYRFLYIDGEVISLKSKEGSLKMDKDSLEYSSAPSEHRETVKEACRQIGLPVAEVVMRSGLIYDVRPAPDLGLFDKISGKNSYQKVAEFLKGDER